MMELGLLFSAVEKQNNPPQKKTQNNSLSLHLNSLTETTHLGILASFGDQCL